MQNHAMFNTLFVQRVKFIRLIALPVDSSAVRPSTICGAGSPESRPDSTFKQLFLT